MGKLLLIIALAIIFFILDAATNPCVKKTPQVIAPLLFHHMVYTFALLGWILDDPVVLLVYIALPIIVILHWRSNNNSCFVDQAVGNICGEPTEFNHIGRKLGVPEMVTSTIVVFGVLVASYKLYKIVSSGKPPKPVRGCKTAACIASKRCTPPKHS
jgi:hypothetical protein